MGQGAEKVMGSEIQWDVVVEYCTRLPAAVITFTFCNERGKAKHRRAEKKKYSPSIYDFCSGAQKHTTEPCHSFVFLSRFLDWI